MTRPRIFTGQDGYSTRDKWKASAVHSRASVLSLDADLGARAMCGAGDVALLLRHVRGRPRMVGFSADRRGCVPRALAPPRPRRRAQAPPHRRPGRRARRA